MKKITLDLNEMAVETFELGATADWRGTVHGQESVGDSQCLTVYPELSCACTNDPRAADCNVSNIHCSEAEPCVYTVDTTCTCSVEFCS